MKKKLNLQMNKVLYEIRNRKDLFSPHDSTFSKFLYKSKCKIAFILHLFMRTKHSKTKINIRKIKKKTIDKSIFQIPKLFM